MSSGLAACVCHMATTISRLVSAVLSPRTGDGPLYLLLALLAWLDGERGMGFLRAGLTVFALELPLYLLLKNYIKREHTSTAGLLAPRIVTACLLAIRRRPLSWPRWWLSIIPPWHRWPLSGRQ